MPRVPRFSSGPSDGDDDFRDNEGKGKGKGKEKAQGDHRDSIFGTLKRLIGRIPSKDSHGSYEKLEDHNGSSTPERNPYERPTVAENLSRFPKYDLAHTFRSDKTADDEPYAFRRYSSWPAYLPAKGWREVARLESQMHELLLAEREGESHGYVQRLFDLQQQVYRLQQSDDLKMKEISYLRPLARDTMNWQTKHNLLLDATNQERDRDTRCINDLRFQISAMVVDKENEVNRCVLATHDEAKRNVEGRVDRCVDLLDNMWKQVNMRCSEVERSSSRLHDMCETMEYLLSNVHNASRTIGTGANVAQRAVQHPKNVANCDPEEPHPKGPSNAEEIEQKPKEAKSHLDDDARRLEEGPTLPENRIPSWEGGDDLALTEENLRDWMDASRREF